MSRICVVRGLVAMDASFETAFEAAYRATEEAGIPSSAFRKAWKQYMADVRGGLEFSPHADTMMNGFMLGQWLRNRTAHA